MRLLPTKPMNLEDYYDRRAPEYEEMYFRDDPERLDELRTIEASLRGFLCGRHVLEIACGTGYWTQRLADVAEKVLAIDSSPQMLALARSKNLPVERVRFQHADAFALETLSGDFDAAVANFWLSHVPQEKLTTFLDSLHRRLGSGARVVMADNRYLPHVGGELVTPEGSRNSYKRRSLADGSEHLVLKNYYSADQLRELFAESVTDFEVTVANHFWWLSYRVT